MKVLIVGSGGREHCLAWKISQSPLLKELFSAPGNAGTQFLGKNIDIKPSEIEKLADFSQKQNIDLTIVGPELPLVLGLVDEFRKRGLNIIGPDKQCAQLEASKVFAKELMHQMNIPTAEFEVFSDVKKAKEYINSQNKPLVIKADGLAAGKGVIVAENKNQALEGVKEIMENKKFGSAGDKIIIEEKLSGQEASILALTDGETIIPLLPSQDHKQAFDQDKGPNTGGMGAYAPAFVINRQTFKEVKEKILKPAIEGLKKKGCVYKGVLYAGLMLTEKGPYVLEFNVRFGDPETQAVLPLLRSNLLDIFLKISQNKLGQAEINWRPGFCVSVVLASGGYPGKYEKGKEITGIENAEKIQGVKVFYAGAKTEGRKIITSGGRVLNVSAAAETLKQAKEKAYQAVGLINFENMHFRRDIADKALKEGA